MSEKSFLASHRMKAGAIANIEAFAMVLLLLFAKTQTDIVTPEILEYAMLAYVGAIGVWGIGVGTNGYQRIKEVGRPPSSSAPLTSPSVPPNKPEWTPPAGASE